MKGLRPRRWSANNCPRERIVGMKDVDAKSMDSEDDKSIPRWLLTPGPVSVKPPVVTRPQDLPFHELAWEAFEKLCLRLVRVEAEVEHCQSYGTRGEDQEGIDLYARKRKGGVYQVFQCKREKDFDAAKIKAAVDRFLRGAWARKAKEFVLCSTESLVSRNRAEEFEKHWALLGSRGVELVSWSADQLSPKLKHLPEIVDDFFGREWVKIFCGENHAKSLGDRADVQLAIADDSDVIAFLGSLATELNCSVWWRGSEPLKISDLFIERFILTKRSIDRVIGVRPMPDETMIDRQQRSLVEELEAERYETPLRIGVRELLRWNQVTSPGRVRLAVKGAPGGGKTFLTRQTVAQVARHGEGLLKDQQAGIEDIEVVIWTTAAALAEARSDEIEVALIEAMSNSLQLRLDAGIREWLRSGIREGRAWIVVDALDELLGPEQRGFSGKAKRLNELKARVIVTCRTMHWEERRGWLGWGGMSEVELVPFEERQQKEFVEKFFANRSKLLGSIKKSLRSNYGLRQACATPLILTFACLLHEEGELAESTSYVELYKKTLRRLFNGEWRQRKPSWHGNKIREERCLEELEAITWGMFKQKPTANRFTMKDWEKASREMKGFEQSSGVNAELLEELERLGFIVDAGYDERGSRCWSYIHRTIQEFLSARWLSRRPVEEWRSEARKHLWFEPQWIEVLIFLGGLVENAIPLIEAVEQESDDDDLFGSMLYLKARLTGSARSADSELLHEVCDEVLSFWSATTGIARSEFLREFALPMFTALGANKAGGRLLADKVLEFARNKDFYHQKAAAEVLVKLGDPRALPILLDFEWDWEDNNHGIGTLAKEALGSVGTEALIALTCVREPRPVVLSSITGETWHSKVQFPVREFATRALGEHSDQKAIDRLLELSQDEAREVRGAAASALGRVASNRAVDRLFELIHDSDHVVCVVAGFALYQKGYEQGFVRLLELTKDESEFVRWPAAEALGKVGGERAAERLFELTADNSMWVCTEAMSALGEIRGPREVQRLLELIGDQDWNVCSSAEGALSRIESERWVDVVWENQIWRDNWLVRRAAARALGMSGDHGSVDKLLELADDVELNVQIAAVEALRGTQNERAIETLLGLASVNVEPLQRPAVYSVSQTLDELPHEIGAKTLRRAAIFALSQTGHERAVEILLEFTKGGDFDDWKAVRELGQIGDERAVDRLLELVGHDHWRVRRSATRSLWQIAWKYRIKISRTSMS